MKTSKYILFILLNSMLLGCLNNDKNINSNKDICLSNIYKKFEDNKYDYGEQSDEGRDSILNRFKTTLLKTLSENESATFSFDSLSKKVKIINSKNNKLRIFSWDE